jgi:hypothetical protein
MKKIEMGVYYNIDEAKVNCSDNAFKGIVKTIGKAIDAFDGTTMIIYSTLKDRGYVDKTFVMSEKKFAEMLD